MNKLLVSAVAAFAVMGATFAFAADATGNIKAINATARTVTLTVGTADTVYTFPMTVDITKVKVGDKVKITFTATGTGAATVNNASAIAAAS
jgi:Cu/Ag efflux protein CusF